MFIHRAWESGSVEVKLRFLPAVMSVICFEKVHLTHFLVVSTKSLTETLRGLLTFGWISGRIFTSSSITMLTIWDHRWIHLIDRCCVKISIANRLLGIFNMSGRKTSFQLKTDSLVEFRWWIRRKLEPNIVATTTSFKNSVEWFTSKSRALMSDGTNSSNTLTSEQKLSVNSSHTLLATIFVSRNQGQPTTCLLMAKFTLENVQSFTMLWMKCL